MTPAILAADAVVPLFGALLCAGPAVSRPTLQFGVRVPPARAGAPVIGRERRAYRWRTAAVAAFATAAVIAVQGRGSWWLPRVVLLLEVAADAGCFWLAHQKITAAKAAEAWFAGLRQTTVADTTWRTQPQPFPLRWLIPAVTVIAATAITGIARYPSLPAHLTSGLAAPGGHLVPRSPLTAFAVVAGQLYVTAAGTGILVLIHRSRPDIDTADPAGSLHRYRKLLAVYARAALTLLALVDATLLLAALQFWQVCKLPGAAASLVLLPAAAGILILIAVAMRAGRDRDRPVGTCRRLARQAGTDRDDDRFWKAGLVYVNRSDPAIMVTTRFSVGWTPNLGNPAAWLLIAAVTAAPAGLALLRIAAGL